LGVVLGVWEIHLHAPKIADCTLSVWRQFCMASVADLAYVTYI